MDFCDVIRNKSVTRPLQVHLDDDTSDHIVVIQNHEEKEYENKEEKHRDRVETRKAPTAIKDVCRICLAFTIFMTVSVSIMFITVTYR